MKATVSAASLKQAISWASKIVHRPVLPILDCLLLSAEDGKITVRATDLSVSLTRTVEATVSEPGQVCVNAKSLKEYLSKVKGKNATVSIESYVNVESYTNGKATKLPTVSLEANAIRVNLPGQDPLDYPLGVHDITWHDSFVFDPDAVNLKQIAKFAAREEYQRVVLKCVLIEVSDKGYRLTTTDGFRLVSTNAIPVFIAFASEAIASYLLPAEAAEMIASLKIKGVLAFGSHKYENGPTVDYAQFTTEDSTVVSRLEDGKFPDYNQIIPASDRGTWATFNTQALAEKLESLATISKDKAYLVKLELSSGKAMLSANDSNGNEATTEMPVDWTGEEFVIAFNAHYMLDCLALCGEQTRIMLENASRPLLIEGNGCLMVVMPIHIQKGRI